MARTMPPALCWSASLAFKWFFHLGGVPYKNVRPVVLELICYCTREKRLINESSTTGGLRKIWTGRSYFTKLKWPGYKSKATTTAWADSTVGALHESRNRQETNLVYHHPHCLSKFFSGQQSFCSRFPVDLLSYDSRTTLLRLNRIEKCGRVAPPDN